MTGPCRAKRLLLSCLALLLLCAPATLAQGDSVINPRRCDINQLVLKRCPNLVVASFDDGRHKWTLQVAGPIALFKKLETYSREPESVSILDYVQFNDKGQTRMIAAENAWFLYDATGDEEVCQAPHIYAFHSKAAAVAAQKELGGELLQWKETARRAREYAADWDPHGRSGRDY